MSNLSLFSSLKLRLSTFLLLSWVSMNLLDAQIVGRNPGHLQFEQFDIMEGFPAILPLRVMQGSHGFLWIGSYEGLIKFDGYDFQVFRPAGRDLQKNIVNPLDVDAEGNILCLNAGKLVRFNPAFERFEPITHLKAGEQVNFRITSALVDDHENIWLATNKGIRIITEDTEVIRTIDGINEELKIKDLRSKINNMKGEDSLSLRNVQNNQLLSRSFKLRQTKTFLLDFMGEVSSREGWADVGWLENEKGDTLWFPRVKESFHAGGLYYNRWLAGSIILPKGSYRLKYRSNEKHAFNSFLHAKPLFPKNWGIRLISIENDSENQDLLKRIDSIAVFRGESEWLSDQMVYDLEKDRLGNIYIGTRMGLDVFSKIQGPSISSDFPYNHVEHIQFRGANGKAMHSCQVFSLDPAADGGVWLAGQNIFLEPSIFTLEYYNPITQAFRQVYHSVSPDPKIPNLGFSFRINQIMDDGAGGIWLGARQNGLYHIPENRLFNNAHVDKQEEQYFYQIEPDALGPMVHNIATDLNDNLWITTNSRYLYKLNHRSGQTNFTKLPEVAGGQSVLPWTVFVDSNEKVWIVTKDQRHIICFDSNSNSYEEIVGDDLPDIRYLIANFEDSLGNIWFGTMSGYIVKYDRKGHQLVAFKIGQELGYTNPFLETGDGKIWGVDRRSELFTLDPISTELKTKQIYSDSSKLRKWDSVTFMRMTSDSTIWMGYGAGGVGKLTLNILNTVEPNSLSEYLPGYRAMCLAEDRQGDQWIGTNINGLLKVNDSGEILQTWTIAEGLLNNNIHGLFLDRRDRLWIHTLAGIQYLDLGSNQIQNISSIRKLAHYGLGATHMNQDGLFALSNRDGIHLIELEKMELDTFPPKMVLTKFLVNNGELNLNKQDTFPKSITDLREVKLSYNQNNLAISYAGIHYEDPKEHKYAYRLKGQDDQWLEVGKERVARFSKLGPGKYTFEVKGANPDGVWSKQPATLLIHILPPWYWNNLSKVLYLMLGIGMILLGYQFQLNRRLAEAEAYRLAELDRVKSRVYTNITHEFRTPLTIILGMVDQIQDSSKQWLKQGLPMIQRNALRVLHLVNQMLNLAKAESNSLQVVYQQGNIINLLSFICQSFEGLARQKGITLQFLPHQDTLLMDFDEEKFAQIVTNLLDNAIKYIGDGTEIRVQTAGMTYQGMPQLLLTVADEGIGIAEDQLPFIFDRFKQVDDTSTRREAGTGIGLALTQELVKLLGGEIKVESSLGKGTKFQLQLPISKNAQLTNLEGLHDLRTRILPASVKVSLSNGASNTIPTSDQDRPLLLIVEDNDDVVTYLKSCIPNGQYDIQVATNGQQGIEMAFSLVPDIIISDVMMPEVDGFELLNRLKQDERTSHIPIVMLTAKADIDSRITGLSYGADVYLGKPFNKQELLIRLKKLLELRKLLQKRYAGLNPVGSRDATKLVKEDAFIIKLRGVIEDHYTDEEFGVDILCKKMGVSRTQLHRKLKALTGHPTTYIIRIYRLEKAKELLENTDMNVSEAAYACGFNSPSHFSQVFTKHFGKPPRSYRRSLDDR